METRMPIAIPTGASHNWHNVEGNKDYFVVKDQNGNEIVRYLHGFAVTLPDGSGFKVLNYRMYGFQIEKGTTLGNVDSNGTYESSNVFMNDGLQPTVHTWALYAQQILARLTRRCAFDSTDKDFQLWIALTSEKKNLFDMIELVRDMACYHIEVGHPQYHNIMSNMYQGARPTMQDVENLLGYSSHHFYNDELMR